MIYVKRIISMKHNLYWQGTMPMARSHEIQLHDRLILNEIIRKYDY